MKKKTSEAKKTYKAHQRRIHEVELVVQELRNMISENKRRLELSAIRIRGGK